MKTVFVVRFLLVVSAFFSASAAFAQPFDPPPSSLKVMTWNVEWMFDTYTGDNPSKLAREQSAPSAEYWNYKVSGVADVIATEAPHIVALQEIEGGRVLGNICSQLKKDHQLSYRYAFIQGTDTFTEQDVGFLVRGGLVSYRRHEQSKVMYDSREFYNLSKHLAGEFRWEGMESPLTVMNVHLRATADAEDKRVKQAKLARHWVESQLKRDEDVLVLGDMNSEHFAGNIRGDVAEIVGDSNRPKMVDLLSRLESPATETHVVLDRQFDRIYVSQSLMNDGPGIDWSFRSVKVLVDPVLRGKRDGKEHWDNRLQFLPDELDLSDHFPVVAEFERK